ncbi:MAG: MBL fold metallo-hydrolase [Thermoplasmata archaeon]
MPKISFYGGVGEIGGNKFLLEDDDTKVFLDFGKNFSREKRFFDEPYIQAREERHLLEIGILPRIDGLYKRDPAKFHLDGVIVTHPHADHYDAIRWMKDEYPIYCGATARDLLVARDLSGGSFGEYNIASLTKTWGEEILKKFITLPEGRSKNLSALNVELCPVDHSVPGAAAYIIETSGGTLVYTGDFRMHGPRKEGTEKFLERAKASEPEILLIEGTHISESKVETEREVGGKINRIVSSTTKLVLVGIPIADMDRLSTLHDVAEKCGRKLAIPMKQAFIADALRETGSVRFRLDDEGILIFKKAKKTTYAWEETLETKYSNTVAAEDINKIQEKAILIATIYDMNEMAKVSPEPGSTYILSSSEPFDEEMEIQYERLLNWLDYYGLPLYQVHASGHATPHELKSAIEAISPKTVVPIHTQRPELFKRFVEDLRVDVRIPSEKVPIDW